MLRCWLDRLAASPPFSGFPTAMSDPKVPKTSDSESPTLVPQGNTKLQSGPPSPDSSPGSAASDAPTLIEARTPRRPQAGGPASSIWQFPALLPGTTLGGRYEILQTIGEGGMGAVYKAEDRELGRTVALKVIRPELASNPDILQRFKQEILLASKVTDRNIIRIYDLGDAEGVKFITMEFVEGNDLRHLLHGQGKLPVAEAVDIMEQVVSGLRAAHRMGIIHRDLKPGNIMRAADGRVLVMDFGLARSLQGDGMTRTGTMLGTMEYMSPEQAQAKELDARSDIFTVGLILYELLTGIMPYQAESAIASLLKRTQQRAIPVSDIDKNVPGALSNIVSKCLERDPALRYQSSDDLLADLRAWQGKKGSSKVSVSSVDLWMNRVREYAQGAWPWMGLVLAVVVLAAVFAGMMLRGRLTKATPARNKAVTVLVADFTNHTGDPAFDGALEPMFNVALEGASFINGYSRESARKLAEKLPHPTDKLDEQAARLVAVSQSISAVITGEVTQRGDRYDVSAMALDAVTGNVLATAEVSAANKDALLHEIPKLVAPIRKALGDATPESEQFHALSGAFNVGSLEALHLNAIGIQQQSAGKYEEALQTFSKAAELDPNFAAPYAGMAAMAENLGKRRDAEKYIKVAMEHEDRMTERERGRIRGLYYAKMGDWQKCLDEYTQLVSRYPADRVGHTNLAVCYAQLRNIPKAIEESQRAVEIVPKGAQPRLNLSFHSSLGGDFQAGEREARAALELSPSASSYLLLAEAQLGQGQLSQAAETYHTLEKLNPSGVSMASSGLADLAAYQGRFADAVRILKQGAAADLAAKNPENAATKYVALGQIHMLRGERRPALEAASKALVLNQAISVRLLAAQIFVEAGEIAEAQKIATTLSSELQYEPQAYGKIIEAKIALKRGDTRGGIKELVEANKLLDTWIGRFELGRAYLDAGLFVEADSEFDRCIRRRGEAMELFQDNVPSYAYFPLVYYYQGRVREGLKSPGFAESYRNYLSIRGTAGEDPLLPEIRRRLGQ
jgi:serine/threonine protein kinase/tetratricopeptide (TPR) repeat protein